MLASRVQHLTEAGSLRVPGMGAWSPWLVSPPWISAGEPQQSWRGPSSHTLDHDGVQTPNLKGHTLCFCSEPKAGARQAHRAVTKLFPFVGTVFVSHRWLRGGTRRGPLTGAGDHSKMEMPPFAISLNFLERGYQEQVSVKPRTTAWPCYREVPTHSFLACGHRQDEGGREVNPPPLPPCAPISAPSSPFPGPALRTEWMQQHSGCADHLTCF